MNDEDLTNLGIQSVLCEPWTRLIHNIISDITACVSIVLNIIILSCKFYSRLNIAVIGFPLNISSVISLDALRCCSLDMCFGKSTKRTLTKRGLSYENRGNI